LVIVIKFIKDINKGKNQNQSAGSIIKLLRNNESKTIKENKNELNANVFLTLNVDEQDDLIMATPINMLGITSNAEKWNLNDQIIGKKIVQIIPRQISNGSES
jgi:hypothetical protein